jgi:type IV secretion system protein VirB9
MNSKRICIAGLALALSSVAAVAQEASARTVQYHSQDIVPIHAKLKYTTLIEVPPTEKIMEAATGDKDFWIVDVVGNFCFVHPASVPTSTSSPTRATFIHSRSKMCRATPQRRT